MKALKQWTFAITIDGIYAALFYLWQFKGMEGAGNILLTFLWLIVPLGFLAASGLGDTPLEKLRRPKSLSVFMFVTTLTVFGALAWVGHEVLASLYLFVSIWCYSARCAAIAKAEKAAAPIPNNLLIISGGPGSGKTAAIKAIGDYWHERYGSGALRGIDPAITQSALSTAIAGIEPRCVILDEAEGRRDLDLHALAAEFPGVHFIAAK